MWFLPCVSFVLEAPEELQGEFVGEEHGGAHGEASNGIDWRSAEENLRQKDVWENFKQLENLLKWAKVHLQIQTEIVGILETN